MLQAIRGKKDSFIKAGSVGKQLFPSCWLDVVHIENIYQQTVVFF